MSTASYLKVSLGEGSADSSPEHREAISVRSGIPRLAEAVIALVGLVAFAPLILVGAAAVVLTSKGPAMFRQRRVGLGGNTFVLYKLRTMRDASNGPQVTTRNDERVTKIGQLLRKTKVDELPELWNVLKGDMSLVGPRPEVPRYVDLANPLWALVLLAKPGVTDPVTVRLRNEEELLQAVGGDSELFYSLVLQPIKLKGYLDYLHTRNWRRDLQVLWDSGIAVLFPGTVPPLKIREELTLKPVSHAKVLNSSR